MLDDLIEPVAAMDERGRQVLAEKAVGEENAGDQRQRPSHEPAACLEDEDDQRRADNEIGRGEKAGAADDVDIEHPIVDAGEKTGDAERPEEGLGNAGFGDEVANEGKAQQQEEAHMHGAHDLAGQRAIGGGPELEQGENDGDGIGCGAGKAGAESGRQSLDCFFRVVGLLDEFVRTDFTGLRHVLFPPQKSGRATRCMVLAGRADMVVIR